MIFLIVAANGSPVAEAAEMPATQNPSTTHLTFNPPCPMVNETVALTAKVLGAASGTGTLPTGTVTFTQGSTQLGTAMVDQTSGIAIFPTSFPATGQYSITASYGGDPNYLPSSDTETLQVGTACLQSSSTTLSIVPDPALLTDMITFTAHVSAGTGLIGNPTGTVTFNNGSTQLGSAPVDSTTGNAVLSNYMASSLGLGSYQITANYSGDSNYLPSVSPAVRLDVVNMPVPTTTTLNSSAPGGADFGSTVTFTAVSSAGFGSPPTGTMTFNDGGTEIGQSNLNSSGAASFSTSSLTVGTHTITAVYSGDSHFLGSTSPPLSQVINNSTSINFLLSVSPSTITVNQGNSGTANVTLTPSGGFSQTVTFLCSGLPIYSQCTFNPPTITPNGNNTPSTVVMTVSTNVATARLLRPNLGRSGAVLAVFSMGILGLIQVRRPRNDGRRTKLGRYMSWFMLLISIAVVSLLVSCGGSGGNSRVLTPKGMSTVTVAGSTPTGAQTTTFTLTVQ